MNASLIVSENLYCPLDPGVEVRLDPAKQEINLLIYTEHFRVDFGLRERSGKQVIEIVESTHLSHG